MEIEVRRGKASEASGDVLLVYALEQNDTPLLVDVAKEVDRALDGTISTLGGEGEIRGKANELTVLHTFGKLPAKRVAVAGLGKAKDFSIRSFRNTIGETSRALRKLGATSVTATLPRLPEETAIKLNPIHMAQAIVEGFLLGLYTFTQYKKGDDRRIDQLTILYDDTGEQEATTAQEQDQQQDFMEQLRAAAQRGEIIADGVRLTRDLVNEPPNVMTPAEMAERAKAIAAETGLEFDVLDRDRMQELGMGALLAVAQGTRQPPQLIVLKYMGADADKPVALALVGKGVTFDTGGISIKPSEGMGAMKTDMAGGAAVIGAMQAIARLKPQLNVIGLVPASENMPDGNAFRPSDIIRAMNGKTIEIITTDAEGRLLLADAICYARKLGAERLVDAATLTGACAIALGPFSTGLFANDQVWADLVLDASKRTGEYFWQMPMHDEYMELMTSDVADLRNAGTVRLGGAITAAKFISAFADDTPWVHLDIAPTANTDRERGINVKGGTGVPTRSFIQLALMLAEG